MEHVSYNFELFMQGPVTGMELTAILGLAHVG